MLAGPPQPLAIVQVAATHSAMSSGMRSPASRITFIAPIEIGSCGREGRIRTRAPFQQLPHPRGPDVAIRVHEIPAQAVVLHGSALCVAMHPGECPLAADSVRVSRPLMCADVRRTTHSGACGHAPGGQSSIRTSRLQVSKIRRRSLHKNGLRTACRMRRNNCGPCRRGDGLAHPAAAPADGVFPAFLRVLFRRLNDSALAICPQSSSPATLQYTKRRDGSDRHNRRFR